MFRTFDGEVILVECAAWAGKKNKSKEKQRISNSVADKQYNKWPKSTRRIHTTTP